MIKIIPCKTCGHVDVHIGYIYTIHKIWTCTCNHCGQMAETALSKEKAIMNWNKQQKIK